MEYLVIVIVLCFFVLGIVLRVKKGTIGEQMVSQILGSLPKEEYTVINDLLLVLRHGSYGRFYGCSNYPKCKFTMND